MESESVPPLEDMTEILKKTEVNQKTLSCTNKNLYDDVKQTSSSSEFGGFQKGFLCTAKKSDPKTKRKEIPYIKAKPASSNLVLKEVQEAMSEKNSLSSFQNNLASHIEKHPKVSKVLSDPEWLKILDEFQKDAEKAMIKYKDNQEIKETMQELCSILGDSFLHMASPPRSEDESLCRKIIDDRGLQEAMTDPFIEELLKFIKEGRNDLVHRRMSTASPSERSKIQMMIDYGLLSFAS